MYQIDGRDVLFDWLSKQQDMDRRMLMLEWFVEFARDPVAKAYRLPGVKAPVYLAIVPTRPRSAVKFLLAEQFRTVKIISIDPLP